MRIIRRLLCKILGHKLRRIKDYGGHSQKIYCDRCRRFYGINHDIQALVEWDNELEEAMGFIEDK